MRRRKSNASGPVSGPCKFPYSVVSQGKGTASFAGKLRFTCKSGAGTRRTKDVLPDGSGHIDSPHSWA
jgi:hypothetical protein